MKRFIPFPPPARALRARLALLSSLALALPVLAAGPATEATDAVPEPSEEGEVLPRLLQPFEAAEQAARFLVSRQCEDGSWPGEPRETTTAWVVLALCYNQCPYEEWAEPVHRGIWFLLDRRLPDGSFASVGARSRADAEAPVHALIAAARATGNPLFKKEAGAAAHATFGTNAPPDFLRELYLLSWHPAFARAFIDIQRERARALVPRSPANGRPTGCWVSAPDYGDLARLLPGVPWIRLPPCVVVVSDEDDSGRDILCTAASLLVPGAMGVTRRLPPSAETLAAADALAKARLDAPPAVFDEPRGYPRPGPGAARDSARRWLLAQQVPSKRGGGPGGWWPGADPVVDTSLAMLALALGDPDFENARGENLSDAYSRAVQFLARTIRPDGTFPVRDPEGDAAALPVLALRVLAGICPHPDVRDLLRKAGADPDDAPAFFGERLLLALCDSPQGPSVSDWRVLSAAERAARRWEARPASESSFRAGPKLLLHWEEPPDADFLLRGSPISAAAFRPLPVDATPEARAIRATIRWLLVPPDKTIRHLLPPPVPATNAPSVFFSDDVKVTVRRHAEGAEE